MRKTLDYIKMLCDKNNYEFNYKEKYFPKNGNMNYRVHLILGKWDILEQIIGTNLNPEEEEIFHYFNEVRNKIWKKIISGSIYSLLNHESNKFPELK